MWHCALRWPFFVWENMNCKNLGLHVSLHNCSFGPPEAFQSWRISLKFSNSIFWGSKWTNLGCVICSSIFSGHPSAHWIRLIGTSGCAAVANRKLHVFERVLFASSGVDAWKSRPKVCSGWCVIYAGLRFEVSTKLTLRILKRRAKKSISVKEVASSNALTCI